MFYFIESHYNDFVHNSFNCTRLYIFKVVTNPLQKLKNGPLDRVYQKTFTVGKGLLMQKAFNAFNKILEF